MDAERMVRALAGVIVVMFAMIPVAEASPTGRTVGWTTYQNARFGFAISYPPGLFSPSGEAAGDAGQLFVSSDGRARLLVGALENGEGLDLRAYRDFVKRETYPGARFDYEPVGRAWFVVSGRRGDQHFYQWVTFVCGGRLINSWAMTYPDAERRRYDPVVEAVAKSFRASGTRPGACS